MHCQLRRGQREDEPAAADIDVPEREYVTENARSFSASAL
jgi:hypothetical protein